MSEKILRIGNAGGYWGDDPDALRRQVEGGELDYITLDFLAEVTMSIMQKQRAKDPEAGYARDFITMLEPLLPRLLEQKTRIITNAGGINPAACAQAIEALADKLGVKVRLAVVMGDDIMDRMADLQSRGATFENMETGEHFHEIQDRVESANVYFGALPVVEALKFEPDIIVTGRVTDTGITLAPMIHHFGWSLTDWDKLAAGIIAGHIIECGCQSTGGNFTDWHKVPDFCDMGYPVIEMSPDGTFVVTKHPGTGGLVSVDTVREQVFYEMGDPRVYITPDVVADFSSIRLTAAGDDRVAVSGIRGAEPTPLYKVSMAYRDGYKASGSIVVCGPEARAKAETFAHIFWQRLGNENFLETATEYYGWNACHGELGRVEDGAEILLRFGARAEKASDLRRFGKQIPALILGGPPGTAVTGGVPRPQDVVSYWPALMDKTLVNPVIARYEKGLQDQREVPDNRPGNFQAPPPDHLEADFDETHLIPAPEGKTPLSRIALGRSGDKGDTANIGILARSEEAYKFLDEWLTAQRVKDLFQELCHGKVLRYSLPGLRGFNFLLEEALGGGGTRSLRIDPQGKTFAQALLRQTAPIPLEVLESLDE